jgi:hypothetical protein
LPGEAIFCQHCPKPATPVVRHEVTALYLCQACTAAIDRRHIAALRKEL